MHARAGTAATIVATIAASEASAHADESASCTVLCSPEVELEPTLSVGNLVAQPRVEDTATGQVKRSEVDSVFEATLALGIPTEVRLLSFTLETTYAPFEDDNAVEFEAELNIHAIDAEWTAGWLGAHADIVAQISPRARPGASAYTHKLDFELDVALYAFNWLPPQQWLHHAAFEASFDYLATGLPRRGDVVEGAHYLDDANGLSVSLAIVIPLAPLDRS